jgi:adenylate kinase
MNKDKFEKIIEDLGDIKNMPNNKLIEIMDELTNEFESVKNNIIISTHYLDKIEELYDKSLDEYQNRNNETK